MPFSTDDLLERVMPLPKQAVITRLHSLPAAQCAITADGNDPPVQTAVRVLQQAMPGAQTGAKGALVLRLRVLPGDAELSGLPNADQAYRIRPLAGSQTGLELVGTTGVGVLYAARTLAQMITSTPPQVAIPDAAVLDWPDLAERGQWGGDAAWDMARTAPLKMNLVEVGVRPALDKQGKLSLQLLTPPICAEAQAQGVKALPYVPHLGDLGKFSNLFERRPGLMSTPNPDEPLPPDYKPSICFSKPAAAELLAELMVETIKTLQPCGNELNIWLTEEGVPCFCDGCRGQNTYVLETQLIAAAYHMVKKDYPAFKLRILLTQGSYPVNNQVLAAVPPDMGVTYYSGTHTYDSSHQPMIYPLLAGYAGKGGWLGVYPQLDNSWRTVFPFTSPQFIRARMTEFAGKKLQSVTGYATPSNKFWAFNVAGLAEWGWNATGRDEKQFARAWARRQGIADVAGFAEWACMIGPLSWDLAGGHFPMRLFWDPARSILEKPTAMAFGEGFLAEIVSAEHLERNIAAARQALALAQTLQRPECVAESQIVLNAYLFLKALFAISETPRTNSNAAGLGAQLAALDQAANSVVDGLWTWGCIVYPDTPGKPQHRFEETMSVFAQVVTEAYRFAAEAGVVDPRPAWRDRAVGSWTEKDFRAGHASLGFDVTGYLAGAGPYRVMFRYVSGGYGADILSASLWRGKGRGARRVAHVEPKAWGYGDNPPSPHIGRYEAWNDVRLDVPALEAGARYYLRVRLGGLPKRGQVPAERRTTRGEICLRSAWA
jgi:hypothetical protein